jgi:hypothetical protein
MGCDIHAFVEYAAFTQRDGEPFWDCIMSNVGHRDYKFFSVLADCGRGEHQPLFPNRGLPEGKLSHTVSSHFWVRITDDPRLADEEGFCTMENAETWAKHGETIREEVINDKTFRYVSHPDIHSTSWLTAHELAQVIAWYITDSQCDYPYGVEWDAALAAMRALEERGHKTRLVFGFDN